MNKQNDSKDERRNKTTKRNNYKTYLTFAIILHIGAQLYYSYLQELTLVFFQLNQFWSIVASMQAFIYFLLGITISQIGGKKDLIIDENEKFKPVRRSKSSLQNIFNLHQLSYKVYVFHFISQMTSRILGILALKYINYSTKIMFQSSTIIPIMVLGVFQNFLIPSNGVKIKPKSYSSYQYFSAFFLIISLCLVSLADQQSPNFNYFGIIYSIFDVLLFAYKILLEEYILVDLGGSTTSFICFSNFLTSIVCLCISLFTNQIDQFLEIISFDIICKLFEMGYIIIKLSNGYITSIVSSSRKFVTIIVSLYLSGKRVSLEHIIGCTCFILGLFITTYEQKKILNEKNNK